MDQIIGFVERITYVSDEGFTVAKLKQENSKDLLIIVGSMPSIQVGESIKCMGRFIQHKKFGLQFEVSEYEVTAPSDVLGIQKYLESGLIKGVGKVYAKIIIEAFGKDTLEIIDKEPEKLLKLSGFGKKRVEKIKECFDAQRAIRDLIIFLKSFDISPSFASKIYKTYQDDSIVKIKKNPYQLAKDIFGIGFKFKSKRNYLFGAFLTKNVLKDHTNNV